MGDFKMEKIGHSLSESAVRRRARTRGFMLKKSRQQQLHLNNCGEYMLVDFNNWVRFGERYDATLEEIDEFLSRQDAA
jgi:hypothetical protein